MEQAAAAYRQAAEMDPQYAEAHIALGNVLRSHGLLEEAIWEYQQGLAILQHSNPGDARLSAAYAHAYLGMAYLEQGKPDLAAREFAADPGMMDGLTDWAWSNLGPVPTSFIDVGNLDLGYVRGFHGRESDGDLSYRWSEGTAFIKFLHVKGGSLKLSLRLSGWRLGEAPPARVSILANGRLLTDFVAPKEMRTYEFIITEPTFTSDDLTIEIRSSTFVAGEGDTRALGVIVDWAKVEELNGG
jgi:tetratricopeptide (TPR) repeat protein